MSSPVSPSPSSTPSSHPPQKPRGLTPLEARARLPFQPVLTSDGLGWPEGIVAESYRAMPPGEVYRPAEDCHRLVFLTGATHGTHVGWRFGGLERPDGPLCRPGDGAAAALSFIPAGREREWRWWGGALDCLTLSLSQAFVTDVAEEAGLDPTRVELLDRLEQADPRLWWRVCDLCAELNGPADPDLGGFAAGSLARSVAAGLLRRHAAHPPRQEAKKCRPEATLSPRVIARARARMEAVGRGPVLPVETLAAEAGCSAGHFSRGFRAATGCPPGDYQQRLRAERASDLLTREPDLPLAAVAADCGFSSQSHMACSFRKVFGRSPKSFRRAASRALAALSACIPAVYTQNVASAFSGFAFL